MADVKKQNLNLENLNNLTNFTFVLIKPYSKDNAKNEVARKLVKFQIAQAMALENHAYAHNNNGQLLYEVISEGEVNYNKEDIAKHYEEHYGRPYYPALENCLSKNSTYGMIIKCNNSKFDVLKKIREKAGATIKVDREKGTVISLPDKKSIRYRVPFMIEQNFSSQNGGFFIPENLDKKENGRDKYTKVYNSDNNSVDIYTTAYVKSDSDNALKPTTVKLATMGITENLIHTSDSLQSARREAAIFLNVLERTNKATLNKEDGR